MNVGNSFCRVPAFLTYISRPLQQIANSEVAPGRENKQVHAQRDLTSKQG